MIAAYNYKTTEEDADEGIEESHTVDLFSVQYRSDADSISSFELLTLTGQVTCVAVTQISATQAYALMMDPETMTQLTVFNIDFSGRSYTTKSAVPFSFSTGSFSARFLASEPAEFYFAAIGTPAGMSYNTNQGFVASSLSSRRTNALVPSSWSAATSFSEAEGSEV